MTTLESGEAQLQRQIDDLKERMRQAEDAIRDLKAQLVERLNRPAGKQLYE